MPKQSSPWRASDAAAYLIVRERVRLAASAVHAQMRASDQFADARLQKLAVLLGTLSATNLMDRASLDMLGASLVDRVGLWTPPVEPTTHPTDLGDTFQRHIRPALFRDSRASDEPILALLAGQPGTAPARVLRQVQTESEARVALLSTDLLSAFHPASLNPSPVHVEPQDVARASATWLQAAMRFARENRFSIALDGPFPNPDTTLRVAARFAEAGYNVRLVAMGVSAEDSLLSSTSFQLRQLSAGRVDRLISPREHAHSLAALESLVGAAEQSSSIHRVSIVRGDGTYAHDRNQPHQGALSALLDAQHQPRKSLASAQWLSELRRMSEFAFSLRSIPTPIVDSLLALHELAIRKVVPELPVPDDSIVRRIQMERHLEGLVKLRLAATRTASPIAPTGPATSPASPDHISL